MLFRNRNKSEKVINVKWEQTEWRFTKYEVVSEHPTKSEGFKNYYERWNPVYCTINGRA